jgi:hypothetical protein
VIKIVHLTVNQVPDLRSEHSTIRFRRKIGNVVRSKYQSQRGDVPRMGLQMIRQPVNGLLFFRGEVRTCVGHDVNQTCARLHSDGLGPLPRDFYVTFDDFLTVGKCRLAWRNRDDIGVVFEGWVDANQRIPLLRQLH